jgi:RNA polymerase sigma factor (TIGR02999 family)
VYDELRRIAQRQLRRQGPGHTLNTTALVHEAYLKLVDQTCVPGRTARTSSAVAARAMRQVLINHAQMHATAKRGGGWRRIPFDEAVLAVEEQAEMLLALDEALTRLAALNERLSRVVEYRFFGGMTEEEAATALGVSEPARAPRLAEGPAVALRRAGGRGARLTPHPHPGGDHGTTSAERWRQIEALLDAALDLPPDDARRLPRRRRRRRGGPVSARRVRRLLAPHARSSASWSAPRRRSPRRCSQRRPGRRRAGADAGADRPLPHVREAGHGGMGTVFLAERDDPQLRQRVALKLVRGGGGHRPLVRRFLEERRSSPRSTIPNIARLLDGGITDGRTAVVRDGVRGGHADRPLLRRAGTGVAARLHLFLRVCEAVQYAHRNLVVHRDLKPSNILVTGRGG